MTSKDQAIQVAALYLKETGHVMAAFTRSDSSTHLKTNEIKELISGVMTFNLVGELDLGSGTHPVYPIEIKSSELDLIELPADKEILVNPQGYCIIKEAGSTAQEPKMVAKRSRITSTGELDVSRNINKVVVKLRTAKARRIVGYLRKNDGTFLSFKGDIRQSSGNTASTVDLFFSKNPASGDWIILHIDGAAPIDDDAIVYKAILP